MKIVNRKVEKNLNFSAYLNEFVILEDVEMESRWRLASPRWNLVC